MLRARLPPCISARSVASSSSARTASLHTTATLQSFRKRKSRVAEKANVEKRKERERLAQADRPHVILGNRPSDATKWEDCDLGKALITEKDILSAPIPDRKNFVEGELPTFSNYGLSEDEKEKLFVTLPALSVEGAALLRQSQPSFEGDTAELVKVTEEAGFREHQKAAMFANLVDLRNANARGIAYENRRRCVAEFSEPENPLDTGRPEVQAAILTMRIRGIWDHLSKFKKDVGTRRSLRRLVHERARILKYLKRIDRDRYDRVLERLGLEPASVEGELVV